MKLPSDLKKFRKVARKVNRLMFGRRIKNDTPKQAKRQ